MIRAVPFTSIWLGLIVWILLGGALLSFTGYILYQDYLFANFSKPITGTVDRVFLKVGQGKHGPTYTPCLDYHYQVPGIRIDCEQTVQRDTYYLARAGGSIPLLYVTSAPEDSRIDMPAENQKIRYLSYGLVALSLLVSIGGTWVLLYTLRQNKTYRYLRANGLHCQGIVTKVKFDVVNKGRTRRYYVLFTFRDNQGREIKGRSWYIKPGYEYLWPEQGPIQVYYDAQNPKSFTVNLDSNTSSR
jgi:hypothetical protein